MAIVTGQNRDRAVARPPWVRRHDNQNESVVAGIMLALVIVGIAVFLFWGPLLRLAVTGAWFPASGASAARPAEGAIPPGPAVVVTLDQPVAPSQNAVDEGVAASSALGVPANTDLIAEPAPAGLVGPSALVAMAPEVENSAEAQAEAAAANDAAETAQAAEAARTAEAARVAEVQAARAPVATVVPTAAPAATATPRATPAATSAPTSAPASVAAASGRRARVVGTGGRGVVLYSAPRQGARLPAGILEGRVVSVLGTSGAEWTQVLADSGQTGWVRSSFLAPAN